MVAIHIKIMRAEWRSPPHPMHDAAQSPRASLKARVKRQKSHSLHIPASYWCRMSSCCQVCGLSTHSATER